MTPGFDAQNDSNPYGLSPAEILQNQYQIADIVAASHAKTMASINANNKGAPPPGSNRDVEWATRYLAENIAVNPENQRLRAWRREQLGLQDGDDPEWELSDAQHRQLEARYVEEAYVLDEAEEPKTQEDILMMVVEKMTLGGGEGGSGGKAKQSVIEIPRYVSRPSSSSRQLLHQ